MHTQGQAIKYLERVFGDINLTERGKNANVECPFCPKAKRDKKKLAIRTDNWLCHCWICGFKSKSLVPVLRNIDPKLIPEYLEFAADTLLVLEDDNECKTERPLVLPRGFMLLAPLIGKDVSLLARRAIDYLKRRGLSEEDIWYYKFGITNEDIEYFGRVIMPSFDEKGDLNFFVARAIDKKTRERYRNPPFKRQNVIFNELNIDWTSELTVVEGPFDLTKVNQNATCLLGNELDVNDMLFRKIIENDTPVALALDNDAQIAAINIAKKLIDYEIKVRIVHFPKNIKDPGEMTKKDFQSFLDSAILVESDFTLLKDKIGILGKK